MKKIFKRISTIVLATVVTLFNVLGVKAYEQNIELSDDIVMPSTMYSNIQNYISLVGNLKNDLAVVNQQYVSITQEQFEAIDAKNEANVKYEKEQIEIANNKSKEVNELKEKVDTLKIAAEKQGATQVEKDAYLTELAKYEAAKKQLTEFINTVDAQVIKNEEDFKKLIPSYNDNNWKKLTLLETTSSANKYGVDYFKNSNYYISWVKVSLNGKDYYNYTVYCYKNVETPKYTCEIVDGKYYNSKGVEVTEKEYKTDCETPKTYVCEYKDGKYYNSKGVEVTEKEYKADCETPKTYVCEYKDGKYYNSKGVEVTEKEYKADCEERIVNVCKIVDGKYYDNNGTEVTKAEYEKACITPENPKTGSNINYIYAVLISLVAISGYAVIRKVKKFSR